MPIFNRSAMRVHASPAVNSQAFEFEIQPTNLALGYKRVKTVADILWNIPSRTVLGKYIAKAVGNQTVRLKTPKGSVELSLNLQQQIELSEFKEQKDHFLTKEYQTADGYEIHQKEGQFVVMARKGNSLMEVEVKTQELRDFLDKQQTTWNEILRDNLQFFVEKQQSRIETLYMGTLIPAGAGGAVRRGRVRGGAPGGVRYDAATARARVTALLGCATAEDMIVQLKADGVLSQTGSCTNMRGALQSVGFDLEKFHNVYQYLNEAIPDAKLDRNVSDNLSARMMERRTLKARKWSFWCLPHVNVYPIGKKITRCYRFLTGKRVKTEEAVASLDQKYADANALMTNPMNTPAVQDAAIRAVEDYDQGRSRIPPTAVQRELYRAIITVESLNGVNAANPGDPVDFELIKEMFRAYHEGLFVVQHDPEKCGQRMRKALIEMIDQLATKRANSRARAGHRYKARAPVAVTKEDKQQIYRLFAYVLPLEDDRTSHGADLSPNEHILDEYLAIAEEDDDLGELMLKEEDFTKVGQMQKVLYDEI